MLMTQAKTGAARPSLGMLLLKGRTFIALALRRVSGLICHNQTIHREIGGKQKTERNTREPLVA